MFPNLILNVFLFRFGDRELIKFLLRRPVELNHHR